MIRRSSSAASQIHEDDPRPDSNPDVFSDDYAESIAESYADSVDAQSIGRVSSRSSLPERQTSTVEPLDRNLAPIPGSPSQTDHSHLRAGIQKSQFPPPNGHRSRGRRGSPLHPLSTNSHAHPPPPATIRRSLSTRSSFAGSQSPVSPNSPDGPSHPYAMYPQGLGLSRATSVLTAATRPHSQTTPSRTPAHPYGLYPQSVVEDEPAQVQQTIPVGFVGANQQFHRRIGPEGEEQDIVGPDGHTEQLPPYSRYPDQGAQKTNADPIPPQAVVEESSATREPRMTPAQLTAADPPTSPILDSSESETVRAASASTQPSFSEKSWNEKSWKEKRETRVCGLPLWGFGLLLATLILVAVVCGAVIGGLVGRAPSRQHDQTSTTTDTDSGDVMTAQTYGALATNSPTTIIEVEIASATPTDLLSLPTGVFAISPGDPVKDSAECLPANQQGAWSCGLPQDLVGVTLDNTGPAPSMALKPIVTDDMWYGVQPPNVDDSSLDLVTDSQVSTELYAYHFQANYNKFVILHEEELTLVSSSGRRTKRDGSTSDNMLSYNGKALDSQDHPWFCYWPKTSIEALVYVNNDTAAVKESGSNDDNNDDGSSVDQDDSNHNGEADNVPDTASSSLTPSPTTSIDDTTIDSALPQWTESSGSSADIGTTTDIADPGATVSAFPQWANSNGEASQTESTIVIAEDEAHESEVSKSYSLQAPAWIHSVLSAHASQSTPKLDRREDPTPSAPCPRKIKIEERRVPDDKAPPPTCTKMVSAPDLGPNRYRPWKNEQGLLVVLQLDEADPPTPLPTVLGRRQLMRRTWPNACYCVWYSPSS